MVSEDESFFEMEGRHPLIYACRADLIPALDVNSLRFFERRGGRFAEMALNRLLDIGLLSVHSAGNYGVGNGLIGPDFYNPRLVRDTLFFVRECEAKEYLEKYRPRITASVTQRGVYSLPNGFGVREWSALRIKLGGNDKLFWEDERFLNVQRQLTESGQISANKKGNYEVVNALGTKEQPRNFGCNPAGVYFTLEGTARNLATHFSMAFGSRNPKLDVVRR